MSKVENTLDPLQMEDFTETLLNIQMSLCGFGTPEFCSLYSDKHFAIKVKRGMCLFWASCHQH